MIPVCVHPAFCFFAGLRGHPEHALRSFDSIRNIVSMFYFKTSQFTGVNRMYHRSAHFYYTALRQFSYLVPYVTSCNNIQYTAVDLTLPFPCALLLSRCGGCQQLSSSCTAFLYLISRCNQGAVYGCYTHNSVIALSSCHLFLFKLDLHPLNSVFQQLLCCLNILYFLRSGSCGLYGSVFIPIQLPYGYQFSFEASLPCICPDRLICPWVRSAM